MNDKPKRERLTWKYIGCRYRANGLAEPIFDGPTVLPGYEKFDVIEIQALRECEKERDALKKRMHGLGYKLREDIDLENESLKQKLAVAKEALKDIADGPQIDLSNTKVTTQEDCIEMVAKFSQQVAFRALAKLEEEE